MRWYLLPVYNINTSYRAASKRHRRRPGTRLYGSRYEHVLRYVVRRQPHRPSNGVVTARDPANPARYAALIPPVQLFTILRPSVLASVVVSWWRRPKGDLIVMFPIFECVHTTQNT